MKLGLINSAWVQSRQGTAYGIRTTKEIGFDSIDVLSATSAPGPGYPSSASRASPSR